MDALTVILRTPSPIEADVIKGLLETHGIAALITSDLSRTAFPFSLNELRVTVNEEDAERARQIIESHRDEVGPGRVVPFGTEFEPLERAIGYRFRDRGLLEHALTHRSRVHEDASGGVIDNESLEFLGDSVLGFAIADLLFRQFPQHNEGQKSKLKASLVSATSLGRLGDKIGLGDYLILGRGEEKTGGRQKLALISDCYEALIAAIYLDGGIEPAQAFVERQIRPLLADVRESPVFGRDHKSALQERLQGQGRSLPTYRISSETGPDHQKIFHVDVRIDGQVVATGEGRTKKDAEQEAARLALASLEPKVGGFE
jgi:ribonuclease-3